LEYIFHVKTTIDHFGKKLENVPGPKLDHAPTVNLGHTQRPSQSLAENNGKFCRDMRKRVLEEKDCAWMREIEEERECPEELVNVPLWIKLFVRRKTHL